VVDLRKRIGLQAETAGRDMVILVAEHNGEEVGLIVDRVLSVEVPTADAKPVPESVSRGGAGRFYHMVLEQGNEKIVILNIDKILALEER
jgi:chemotaxis signal transduction protein